MTTNVLLAGAYTHTGEIAGYCRYCALYHRGRLAADLCRVFLEPASPAKSAIAWHGLKAAVSLEHGEAVVLEPVLLTSLARCGAEEFAKQHPVREIRVFAPGPPVMCMGQAGLIRFVLRSLFQAADSCSGPDASIDVTVGVDENRAASLHVTSCPNRFDPGLPYPADHRVRSVHGNGGGAGGRNLATSACAIEAQGGTFESVLRRDGRVDLSFALAAVAPICDQS